MQSQPRQQVLKVNVKLAHISRTFIEPQQVVEFGDFQCPLCDRFAKDTEPQINQTYIQTGRVNMAFKHFTIYGPDSITAAIASQCANYQAKFWNFYEMLYKNQGADQSKNPTGRNGWKFLNELAWK
jgi:protein-disulfide isomerase